MKYEILEIVEPSQLAKREARGYQTFNIKRSVLQSVAIYGIVSFHKTMEDAELEIIEHAGMLKDKSLTIIPVISIDINGNIR